MTKNYGSIILSYSDRNMLRFEDCVVQEKAGCAPHVLGSQSIPVNAETTVSTSELITFYAATILCAGD